MTYRELLEKIKKFSVKKLDRDVMAYDEDEDVLHVLDGFIDIEHYALNPFHPVLRSSSTLK